MHLVLVFKTVDSEKLKPFLKDDTKVYSLFPADENLQYENIFHYDLPLVDRADVLDKVAHLPFLPQTESFFQEELTIDRVNLWYFFRPRVFLAILKILPEYLAVLELKERHPGVDQITIFSQHHELAEMLPEVKVISEKSKKSPFRLSSIFNYSLFLLYRVFIGWMTNACFRKRDNLYIFLDTFTARINLKTGKQEMGNPIMGYFLDLLERDFAFVDKVEIPKSFRGKHFRLHKRYFQSRFNGVLKLFSEPVLFLTLLNPRTWKKLKKVKEAIEKTKLQARNLDLQDVEHRLGMLYLGHFIGASRLYMLYYWGYRRFFRKKQIKTLSLVDETGPTTLAILKAASQENITTIGLQHGLIAKTDASYYYLDEDHRFSPKPDYFLAWGEHYKEILNEQGKYDKEKIFITGQPRADVIPVLKSSKDKEHTKFKLLYASQPIPDAAMREKCARILFEGVNPHQDNVELITKLHPNEYHEKAYYERLAAESGIKNPVFYTDEELYRLIASADALVTAYSTVATEAILFGKTLFLIDPAHQDILGLIEKGIAIPVYHPEDLSVLLSDPGRLAPAEDRYSDFISRYAYRIDGQSARRTVDIICSIAHEQNHPH